MGVSIAAICLAGGVAPAMAQDVDTSAQLDEIVVTARKVEENLQDVPVAVTVFSGEQLEQQNVVRTGDISRLTPGFVAREGNNNPTALLLSLRGQFQSDTLATLDPSVGTYVDGLYWARAYGLNADVVDMRNVQVLKGPQGTLFGRNTTGGAVLLQTNDPDPTAVRGKLSGLYGELNERQVSAMLNLPIVEDKVAVRFAVQNNRRDGYQDDRLNNREYGERDSTTARLKLLLAPTPEFSLVLAGEIYDFTTAGAARQGTYYRPAGTGFGSLVQTFSGLFPIPGLTADQYSAMANADPDLVYNDAVPLTDVETETYTATATYDTGIGTFKFIGGRRLVRAISSIDLDGGPYAVHRTTGDQKLEQWSGELQLTGDLFDGAIDYVVGGFYFTEDGYDRSVSTQLPGIATVVNTFRGEIDNTATGGYAQATWHATDKLNFTGGLRYSEEEKGITLRNILTSTVNGAVTCQIASATASPGCLASRSDTFDGWSYTAGVDYNVTGDVLVYAKTSKGFRSGGQNLRASSDQVFIPFAPETVYEHEIGLKSTFLDRRVRLNLAAYMSRLEDAQRSTIRQSGSGTTISTFTVLGNAAEVEVQGAEAELTALLFEGFTLSLTGALTDPEYKDYKEVPTPGNPSGDRSQERFNGVPESTFSVAGTYRRDLGFAEMNLHADYAWQDDTPLDAYNNSLDPTNAAIIRATTTPAAGIWNARASLSFEEGRYELALFGRNLGDNRDITGAVFVDPFGYVSTVRREPRTFGVQATFNY
jgi:iron complex outermembrane receptor protein